MTPYPFSHAARKHYEILEPRIADIARARQLASRLNAARDLEADPARAVGAGVLSSANLLDEIYGFLVARYIEEIEPRALEDASAFLQQQMGDQEFQKLLRALRRNFDAPQAQSRALEYSIRLRLHNENGALLNLRELFDDKVLPQPAYNAALEELRTYFQTLPPFGPDNQNFIDFLFAPLHAFPDSLEAQLRFMLEQWSTWVAPFARRILLSLDVLAEETKPTFHGPGPAQVLEYTRGGAVGMDEFEAFSQDKAWMPSVVLLAKNTYVWLDQLSKKYKKHIYRLDMVPDEELDEMAARGFSGLWLIGLWQRSRASQSIKQMCGNPDAVASAYSLHAYDIAWELGGNDAMETLRTRAAKRGIRMASDMVPNHMAIDSRWVVEHPDWFLSLPHNPYPQYSFDGPNLSEDARCSIFLENHYYSQSDAAVVFRRVDNSSGEERFIYHGNDGTSMPWNDTAQLNYLQAEVREAVIQTILHVARQFPIIRFDAAMTLAKRHYHRLWFPTPGEGGAIPTRAEHGLTPEEFDAAMPEEFWREVVNRVAQEVPETLLLAEAFWMMEGYFVRTLGMHRVYNSAFMNMLRDEKNAEYRLTLKNTLEFDPAILNRFVNFMNNPDEKTAVEQFGKDDKYFGVCTLMATLPGLPMFGHGQLEGYAEKYGMEYPRAYWDESPDENLIARHEREIFPLLHNRALFAGSENFTLYDFWNSDGFVNEDVFAYSNRMGGERALVVYHNRFADTSGWIKSSVAFAEKTGDQKALAQRNLGEALGLSSGEKSWCIFRDNVSQLEYLRSSRELVENGLWVQLNAYNCHVFLDFREVRDDAHLYARLAQKLDGRGVPSVETALRELLLEPIHAPFQTVCDAALWTQLLDESTRVAALDELEKRLEFFGEAALKFCELKGDASPMAKLVRARLGQMERLLILDQVVVGSSPATDAAPVSERGDIFARGVLLSWSIASSLGVLESNLQTSHETAQRSRALLDEWLLAPLFHGALREFGLEENAAQRAASMTRVLLPREPEENIFDLVSGILADVAAAEILTINRYNGVTWFSREGWEEIIECLGRTAQIVNQKLPVETLKTLAAQSEYRVVKFLELARGEKSTPVTKAAPMKAKAAPRNAAKSKVVTKEIP